jgi:hypothetical protein
MEVATAPGTFHESFAHRPIYPYEEIGGICIEFYKDEKPIGRTKNFDYRISQLNSSVDAEGVNQHIFTYTISDASIAIKPYSSCALDN